MIFVNGLVQIDFTHKPSSILQVKSLTAGYASLDYEGAGEAEADIVKLDILLNGVSSDALAQICHRDTALRRGKDMVVKLKETIPR